MAARKAGLSHALGGYQCFGTEGERENGDVLDFALAADEGGVGVHFDEFFGEGLWDVSLCSVSQCVYG
jgi:hypothetical protein